MFFPTLLAFVCSVSTINTSVIAEAGVLTKDYSNNTAHKYLLQIKNYMITIDQWCLDKTFLCLSKLETLESGAYGLVEE